MTFDSNIYECFDDNGLCISFYHRFEEGWGITMQIESIINSRNSGLIRSSATSFLNRGEIAPAVQCLAWLIANEQADINEKFLYAQLIIGKSHKQTAGARDLLLSLLLQHPGILHHAGNAGFISLAARACHYVGPIDKSIDLTKVLVDLTQSASDYFDLSERLSAANRIDESVEALERAIFIDPATYDTEANRETVKLGKLRSKSEGKKTARSKISRYPDLADFHGDLVALIKNFIAAGSAGEEKFLTKQTRFFTMGSCFARNLSHALVEQGYQSHHMEIVEHINTTFANRAFVDWMSAAGGAPSNPVSQRFSELVPANWNPQTTLDIIRNSDVFILTLGVAPAFFDRESGEFVLPRPSALSSKVLAEKYHYRTTSVKENVDNVLYLVDFARSISPNIKFVITVSPVPLMASFEFLSCVQADCLSKSTMRLVAHEIVNLSGLKNVFYWPSFEVFRWAGSNASDYFGADDGSSTHVSEAKVRDTIKAFIDIFSPNASGTHAGAESGE